MSALLRFLENSVVGWLIPLTAAAILFPALQIFVFINTVFGGIVCGIIGGLLCCRAIRQAQEDGISWWKSWQLWVWGIIFLPATILAISASHYFHLWVLFIEGLVLSLILGVPGVVSVTARGCFTVLLTSELVLTTLLYGATLVEKVNVSLIILALLLIALAVVFFQQAARPYQVREAQRRVVRWALRLAVIALILAFAAAWWPLVRGGYFVITGHDPQTERIVIQEVGKSSTPVTEVKVPGVGKYKPLLERIKGR